MPSDSGQAGSSRFRVAITGATGFIGTHLVERFSQQRYRTRALTRSPPRLELPGVRWVSGDLDDRHALLELVTDAELVIHCAGQIGGIHYRDFAHVNITGLRHLLEALSQTGNCRRMLLVSSLAAREPQLSHYAHSKREAEKLLAATDMPCLSWSIFRPPAVYGPGDRALAPFLQVLRHGVCPIPARHDSRWSMLFVTDLVNAVTAWLESAEPCHGKCYELDDGQPGGYSWPDILTVLERLRGIPVRKLSIPRWLLFLASTTNEVACRLSGRTPILTRGKVREFLHPDWTCDNTRICRDLQWRPSFNLEQGLKVTRERDGDG